jgi:hypothetical protein
MKRDGTEPMADEIGNTDEESRLGMSVPDAGAEIGLGRNASYEAARRGEIPTLRFGRRLIVPIPAWRRKLEQANQ